MYKMMVVDQIIVPSQLQAIEYQVGCVYCSLHVLDITDRTYRRVM
jgi:hypothetical protein